MLLSLILASQLWLMSDRASFWDAEKISDRTEWIKGPSFQEETAIDRKEIKGKNVLLLVHGYNDSPEEALSTYRLINAHVSAFKGAHFYDVVIGYLWPGDDKPLQYFDATRHVSKLVKTMRSHLEFLSGSAARVDVIAHSMGNRLMFEALNTPSPKKLIHHFYSLAAAVGSETLEPSQQYYSSTQNCEKIFIFYSKRDEVLKWCYRLAERDEALGYGGAKDPEKLPANIQLINDTNFIGQHSQYFGAISVYEFIKANFPPEKQPGKLCQGDRLEGSGRMAPLKTDSSGGLGMHQKR